MDELNIMRRGRLLGDWLWGNFVLLFPLMILAKENYAEEHKYKILVKSRFSAMQDYRKDLYYCLMPIKKANMTPVCISQAYLLK